MSKITTRCCTAKSIRLFLAVCFVLFLQVIFKTELKAQTDAGSTQNATAGVLGSCNLVIQNFKADIGARVLNQLDCPLSPTESFGVKYLWLDEVSTSFLISGYFDKSLNRLVGDAPLIVKNPVYIRVQEIIDRFGERVHGDSEILRQSTAFGLQTSKQDELGAIIKTTELSNIPARVLQKMKIYRSEPLLLPDLPALRTLVKTAEWPLDYNMTYRDWQFNFSGINFNKGGATAEKVAITCVLLHKLVDRDQLLSYWEDVEKLEAAIGAKELKQEDTISYQVLGSNIKSALVKNPTLDAMAYFGEEFWPDDYLISFGDAFVGPDCGYSGQYNVGLYLLPRRLYTLVAVVEAKAAHLEIDGFTYVVDPNERLRPPSKGSQAVEAPKGVISLKRGETVLIPLRIELRYLPEDAALRLARKKKAEELYSKIMSIPSKQFKLRYVPDSPDESAKIILQKLKTSYRKPEVRSVAESYVFGPAYEIRDIQISGKKISVREVPPTPLTWLGYIGGASCPFLFVDDGSREPRLMGRVLVGAHHPDLSRTEEVKLPAGTRSVFISEREPEIAFLDEILVRAEGGEPLSIAKRIVLHPNDAREFAIPDGLRDRTTLILRGHYRPLKFTQGPSPTSLNGPNEK